MINKRGREIVAREQERNFYDYPSLLPPSSPNVAIGKEHRFSIVTGSGDLFYRFCNSLMCPFGGRLFSLINVLE
ncbi:hypothetical protein CEXT_89771 [Caerostris extrusa]|uniref:Uncharacterized protein n=1 Tax=Caerostris extrusa TaxID=172846 RepID=A0AAV4UP95_CAEEX|nr:hypothetical protein CEXT_89771 [Caerostris extrusa]